MVVEVVTVCGAQGEAVSPPPVRWWVWCCEWVRGEEGERRQRKWNETLLNEEQQQMMAACGRRHSRELTGSASMVAKLYLPPESRNSSASFCL